MLLVDNAEDLDPTSDPAGTYYFTPEAEQEGDVLNEFKIIANALTVNADQYGHLLLEGFRCPVDGCELEEVDDEDEVTDFVTYRWSEPTTWDNDQLPVDGDIVYIQSD